MFFAPLPIVLMVCVFPGQVRWTNYLLLVPALLQQFVFLPRWHRAPYGFDALRTKLVYAWAHLFAFRDRVAGRPLAWAPSGGGGSGRVSGRLGLLKVLLVGWPLVAFLATVVGSLAHMHSALDVDYWPPLVSALVLAVCATGVLRALPPTVYRSAVELEAAERGRPLAGFVAPAVNPGYLLASKAEEPEGAEHRAHPGTADFGSVA